MPFIQPEVYLDLIDTSDSEIAIVGQAQVNYSKVAGGIEWHEVSDYVRRIDIDRPGRQREIGQYETGRCIVELDNREGLFSPTNPHSPFANQLRPMRAIRIQVPDSFTSAIYYLFTGFVVAIEELYPGKKDSIIRLEAYDPMCLLARFDGPELSPRGTGDDPSTRLSRILNNAGVPNWLGRDFMEGGTTLQATNLANNALTEAKLVADSDFGHFFCTGRGDYRYLTREYNDSIFAARPWGIFTHDELTEDEEDILEDFINAYIPDWFDLIYPTRANVATNIIYSYDADQLYNYVSIARSGGTAQTAADPASQSLYGLQTYQRFDLVNQNDSQSQEIADEIVSIYAHPKLRAKAVQIATASLTEAQLYALLFLDIKYGVVTMSYQENSATPYHTILQNYIDGISHRIEPGNWSTILYLSDVEN